MVELPEIIPVFPLPNVVLFPGLQLPLHIFESRYRDMVMDAKSNVPSIIGLALLRGEWEKQYEGNPKIFATGCAGKILETENLSDGRYNILLSGVREYAIEEESFDKSYRRARVTWRPERKDDLDADERENVAKVLEEYLPEKERAAVRRLLSDDTITDELFINFFAFHLKLLPIEKQSVLDATTIRARAECLKNILEFKLSESTWPAGSSGTEGFH